MALSYQNSPCGYWSTYVCRGGRSQSLTLAGERLHLSQPRPRRAWANEHPDQEGARGV